MAEDAGPTPAPKTLIELPEHVRVWLAGMTPERIARYQKWEGFIVWAEQTGKFAKVLVLAGLFVFAAATTISVGWDSVVNWFRWFRGD